MKSAKQILCLLIVSAAMHQVLVAEGPKPEERSDYDQSKDVGLEAPLGATKLFDGTEESIVNHWIMWPNAEMPLYKEALHLEFDVPVRDSTTVSSFLELGFTKADYSE